jgi:hypothetical protein
LSPELWVPGAAEPSLEGFVTRLHHQIEQYTSTHASEQSHVEVELVDGERLSVESISADPGYGFLTLTAAGEQLIVPIGSIRRIRLGPADEDQKPGFALPSKQT